ncbi:MAG: DegT/DnrJ/EryC1/StrS family aminotransferase [Candidatus Izemoplasmatales bacterium]
MDNRIFVTRSSMPNAQEYFDEIADIWDSHILTNMGVKHQMLEKNLKEYLHTPNITLFTNGHIALESAIVALGLTGEIITTPYTFASTTQAIVRNGLTPIFCDINRQDYTIDTSKIEDLITNKTSAIIPVHVYGNICNVHEIERIAKKNRLVTIYDAAHAFGSSFEDINIANFGDASMFSFHATKVFNTIEGGAVTYQDSALSKPLNSLKNFGLTGVDSVDYVGGNGKMNEFQAAMGLCNLRHVDTEIGKRKIVYERYLDRLRGVKGLTISPIQAGVRSNYAYFPVLFDEFWCSRDYIYEKLMNHNIFARKYFYPTTNSFRCYEGKFSCGQTPIANYVSRNILTFPLYADLCLEDVDMICDIVLGEEK